MPQLLLQCRSGFEPECAAEAVADCPGSGVLKAHPRSGWVLLEVPSAPVDRRVPEWTFCRQGFWVLGVPTPRGTLPEASQVLTSVGAGGGAVSGVFGEAPDSEAGRPLWPTAEKLARTVEEALIASRRCRRGMNAPRLHIFLSEDGESFLGLSASRGSAPWPMGIPRLRMSREAPSRSALKLEEAFLRFLPDSSAKRRLRAGMRAVDLGAAPGGWSWELSRRGLRVTAVDNGPLKPELFRLGLVQHLRADGFAYRPAGPVDWMVCDMAAPPGRVARLVGTWGARGLCRESVFNLKLPMKRRYVEFRRCEAVLRRLLEEGGNRYELRFKHLYHDREEVTGHLRVLSSASGSRRRQAGAPSAGGHRAARGTSPSRRPRRG